MERCPNCRSVDPKIKVRRVVGRQLITCENSFHNEDDLFEELLDYIIDQRNAAYRSGTMGHGLDWIDYPEARRLFDRIRGQE